MNFSYQKARDLMVENQLRPNKIKNPDILKLFKEVAKESFLPENLGVISYSDSDITLSEGRGYLKNLHIAQLINYAEIEKKHRILHLGALTGYVTILLANLCSEVIAIETDKNFNSQLIKNVNNSNLDNVKVVEGTFKEGFKIDSPFDIIFIDTPIQELDKKIYTQVNENLGKIIMIKKIDNYLSKAVKITKNINNFSNEYLFDVFSKYELYNIKKGFEF